MKNERAGRLYLPVVTGAMLCLAFALAFLTPGATADRAGRAEPTGRDLRLSSALILPWQTDEAEAGVVAGSGRPTALATADLDGDGVADLVCGFVEAGRGSLVLLRGNPASIYPIASPDASAPFFEDARVVELTGSPDLLAAGDFDADGHADIVTATVGDDALYRLRGDGRGGLGAAVRLDLPGSVTSLVAGEINRADGLPDLAVGLRTGGTGAVLVFEGPRGAFEATAETLWLPEAPLDLALGHLDAQGAHDLVVAAGSDLHVVLGRDRRTSLDSERRAEVAPAEVRHLELDQPIADLALGEFAAGEAGLEEIAILFESGELLLLSAESSEETPAVATAPWREIDRRPALAAVSAAPGRELIAAARISGLPQEEIVLLDRAGNALDATNAGDASETASTALASAPVAVLPMRLNRDALADLVVLTEADPAPRVIMTSPLATFTVTNTNDSGGGSLREAIAGANSSGGADLINFNIGGGGVQTITVSTQLPAVTGTVTIDGYSQPGTIPRTEVGNAVILIELDGAGLVPGNGLNLVPGSGSSTVRGIVIRDFPDDGIEITSSSNIIEGSYIGTNFTGTVDRGNDDGIQIFGAGNTIGGTAVGALNVISGNGDDGLDIRNTAVAGNIIRNNMIGLDRNGVLALGNSRDGIELANAVNNTIGGSVANAPNVVSDNGDEGIDLSPGTTGTLVQGNVIGSDIDGGVDLGNNQEGLQIQMAAGNTIGGAAAGAGNLISGNDARGVVITGEESTNNLVQGNMIGTTASGLASLGNTFGGVLVDIAPGNTIGGTAAGAGNLISGNPQIAVSIQGVGSDDNHIEGNIIGLDIDGLVPLSNGSEGVRVTFGADNVIGGTDPGAGNVITGNDGRGILISLAPASGNRIEGNKIGTDITGLIPWGNLKDGVLIADSLGNAVGGAIAGAGNVIAGNAAHGITITGSSPGNRILGNSFFDNDLLGIDLEDGLITPNDMGDPDVGANNLQNFPVLTSASLYPGGVSVVGSLNSIANTTYRIEYFHSPSCDPSGHGEGRTFIGLDNIPTDGSGNVLFGSNLSGLSLDPGQITATATDPGGNSSEFSVCVAAACGSLVAFVDTLLPRDNGRFQWENAATVRAVRGNLSEVSTYTVFADEVLVDATLLDISDDDPGPGEGMYYLIRYVTCGSWQTTAGAEPPRDAALP